MRWWIALATLADVNICKVNLLVPSRRVHTSVFFFKKGVFGATMCQYSVWTRCETTMYPKHPLPILEADSSLLTIMILKVEFHGNRATTRRHLTSRQPHSKYRFAKKVATWLEMLIASTTCFIHNGGRSSRFQSQNVALRPQRPREAHHVHRASNYRLND